MKLYSTNNRERTYTLQQAVLQGIAADGGLFMPTDIEPLPSAFLNSLASVPFPEICLTVTSALVGDSIPYAEQQRIIHQSMTFPVPLINLSDSINVAELWHGPSLAFKDFGAQFMAQVMAYFNRNASTPLNILVATSGDTGGAVSAGFHNVPGINVVILYPKGKVSILQEKQLTTFGNNVIALEIDGTFDDCQAMVKKAFSDARLVADLRLSSANSINIARLIPQTFYFFEAVKSLIYQRQHVVVSVPSGNFGNLTAGLIAKRMGLPISKYIAATNVNDIVPCYLNTQTFQPKPSVETLSNAMDVGNPSNFARMLELYGSTWNKMISDITGFSYTDAQTIQGIQDIYQRYHYIADPHGAIAYLGLSDYLKNSKNSIGVFLETAHPSKFKDTIDYALDRNILIHKRLQDISELDSHKIPLSTNYDQFSEFLIDSYVN